MPDDREPATDSPPPTADPGSGALRVAAVALPVAAAAAATAWLPALETTAVALRPELAGAHPVSVPLNAAIAGGLGLLAARTAHGVRSRGRALLVCGVAAVLALTQSIVLGMYGILWQPFSAALAIALCGLVSVVLTKREPGASRWLRGRVSRAVLERLDASGDRSWLQPAQREASVVTCRLVNEARLREALAPRDFLKLCDAFREAAARALVKAGGCLDPADTSGMRALFGLPAGSANPADDAAAAAVAADDALREFAFDQMRPDREPPVFGIGVTTGILTAGLTGDSYTAIGDAVENSRWLALQNGHYQSRVLIDERTRRRAEKIEDRPMEILHPPEGAAMEIFQLLGTLGSLSSEARERRDAFRDAMMLLRAGHARDALRRFEDARSDTAPDPVLDGFVAQAQEQSRRDHPAAAPPPVRRSGDSTSPTGRRPRP